MPAISFRPLHELDYVEIADLFNRCFEGYVVPVHLSPAAAAERSRRDGIDHSRSFITLVDEEPVGIALVTPRFDAARLAGMGVVAPARGQGLGRATLTEFLRRLRADGFREAILEVFEQNEPALSLYRSAGFVAKQRLFGFRREPVMTRHAPLLREVPMSAFLTALRDADDLLPFIQTAQQASSTTLPARCWTVDGAAFACFAPPDAGNAVVVTSFIVKRIMRSCGKGRELVGAIQGAHPHRSIVLPQIFPEAVAGFFEHVGFQRMELNQFEMRLEL